jgi:hypothetical protein
LIFARITVLGDQVACVTGQGYVFDFTLGTGFEIDHFAHARKMVLGIVDGYNHWLLITDYWSLLLWSGEGLGGFLGLQVLCLIGVGAVGILVVSAYVIDS